MGINCGTSSALWFFILKARHSQEIRIGKAKRNRSGLACTHLLPLGARYMLVCLLQVMDS